MKIKYIKPGQVYRYRRYPETYNAGRYFILDVKDGVVTFLNTFDVIPIIYRSTDPFMYYSEDSWELELDYEDSAQP